MNRIPIPASMLDPYHQGRFWQYVIRLSQLECWLWVGACHNARIPCFRIERVTIQSSRISWYLHTGKDPGEQLILHSCPNGDNPLCMNPNHLRPGNYSNNKQDAWNRGHTHEYKISDIDVEHLRRLWATGKYTQQQLANIFNITPQHVSDLVNHKLR